MRVTPRRRRYWHRLPCIHSGVKLTNAFAPEKMTRPSINVAVKKANAAVSWAQDIVAGYNSETFKTAILVGSVL